LRLLQKNSFNHVLYHTHFPLDQTGGKQLLWRGFDYKGRWVLFC